MGECYSSKLIFGHTQFISDRPLEKGDVGDLLVGLGGRVVGVRVDVPLRLLLAVLPDGAVVNL